MSRADISAAGSQTATPEQALRVARRLLDQHYGPERPVAAAVLARETGIAGRTVRAAYAWLDGEAFVLGRNEGGLYVAETPEQAASMDHELRSKALSLLRRLRARRRWWKRQQLAQIPLELSA